jgi:hypothetical protein
LGKSGARTIFSIETSNGKDIRAHSHYKHENEILLPPGRYLKVIDILNPAEDLHIIHLREISPPYPMLADPFDLSQIKQALPSSKSTEQATNSNKKENYSTAAATPKMTVPVASKKGKFILFC